MPTRITTPIPAPQEETLATASADPAADTAATKPAKRTPTRKVRYAVIGLGHIAQSAVLPAFAHAKKNSELAALVTGDPAKLKELGKRYDVAALYDYAGLRQCLAEESIDAVYIATPNSEHLPFVREAAQAGIHVLCEKPLGVTERDTLDIINACDSAGVRLMTAYRLHFQKANLDVIKAIKSGSIGRPKVFTSVFSYQIKDPKNIRLRGDLGGGPLHDIGIYCINAARTVFRDEPVQVQAWSARTGDPRFETVEETVSATLRFPGGALATFVCSFGIAGNSWYEVVGDKGSICLDNAYDYAMPMEMTTYIGEKERTRRYPKSDQFAPELIYFSNCILKNQDPEPSGWEGLADVRVIRALQQSIERRTPLEVPATPYIRHPKPAQQITAPAVIREPKLVHARPASE